ncbi:hypothetical protein LSH36_20g10015 [Paralvinella palmiformis]|uniref:Uncharacterized protein n=1 Tax=Paralvinella palmiformis TaxID=53620 RepID=A0AAD9KBM2_9ANNE|nr:hypothetical protein LSH36_20g10015 [Paralvinella palmiformis]
MESPVVQQGTQGVSVTAVTSAGSNDSPNSEPPLMHTLQPLAVTSVQSTQDNQDGGQMSMAQISMAQISASMHPAFVMAPPSSGDQGGNTQLLMQPPVSMPLMVPPYQMILPTQGLVDQQGLMKNDNNSRANTPSSPAVTSSGSRSATPATIYQQQQVLQVSDAQNKTDAGEVAASPARQGSTCSGGSPAPHTPGSLGSPMPQMVADGMNAHAGLHIPLQAGQIPMNLQVGLGLNPQTTVAQTPPPQEEKVDISKLKPPKKPLTPYMRFSKSVSI